MRRSRTWHERWVVTYFVRFERFSIRNTIDFHNSFWAVSTSTLAAVSVLYYITPPLHYTYEGYRKQTKCDVQSQNENRQ